MVLVHAQRHTFERPNPTRIAALSGAMALNFGALLLLLIPITMPTAPPRVDEPTIEVFFPPEAVPIQPVPPIPDAPVINRHREPVRTPVVVQQPETPIVPDATVSEPVQPQPPVESQPAEPQSSGPADVGALATIRNPPPKYPVKPWRAGIEGTVYLRILVGTDGLPLRVEIERGSGNRDLDSEARRHVMKKWVFQPAMRDGVPVEAWGRVPIVFSLMQG